jgi:hypothetical protein
VKRKVTEPDGNELIWFFIRIIVMGISQVLSDFPVFSYGSYYSFGWSTKIAPKPALQLVQPSFANRHIVKAIAASSKVNN